MKRSVELTGLNIISIEDGKETGKVIDFVVNPVAGAVEYLIVDSGGSSLGYKILPFRLISGVGEYAVIIDNMAAVTDISSEPAIRALLEKNIVIKGTRVLTQRGNLIGSVNEFFVDENSAGKIAGCEVSIINNPGKVGLISAEQIVTYGLEFLVVNDNTEIVDNLDSFPVPESTEQPVPEGLGDVFEPVPDYPVEQPSEDPTAEPGAESVAPAEEPEPAVEEEDQPAKVHEDKDTAGEPQNEATKPAGESTGEKSEFSEAAKLFEARQLQFLLGRKASKRIESELGEVIAEEGDIITEEVINKAKKADKFMELSMNTKA